jgi:hypothetical protein
MLTQPLRIAARTLASGMTIAGLAASAANADAPSAEHMPLADYLGLLAQIAPAAEQGAKAYLQAFRQRCGRALSTADLRRAMADGEGEPVLMAMIRASHLGDTAALSQLGSRIACERQAAR